MAKRWKYTGDMDIRYGGLFYRDEGDEDFMSVVEVTPASDGGGPDNKFLITVGTVYMPCNNIVKMRDIADICGFEITDDFGLTDGRGNAFKYQSRDWRLYYMDACRAYHGIDRDAEYIIRVGKPEPENHNGFLYGVAPDYVLRANASLRNFVKREFL